MEMRTQNIGGGVSVGALNTAYLSFRTSEESDPVRYGFGGAGLREPAIADADWVTTEWSPISLSRHPWLKELHALEGHRCELKISGNTMLGFGSVAVEFTVYDKFGHPIHSLVAKFLDVTGGSFLWGERKASGPIHRLPEVSSRHKSTLTEVG
ncbi:hypothetical protein ACFOZ5_00275 [Marinobacter lacisalsi]|uniref:Uncharacterized protein n=1 Tax=Marinobacter lacisalsi TaxID=475979 RepID=A0ABV8QEL9_9GAMM